MAQLQVDDNAHEEQLRWTWVKRIKGKLVLVLEITRQAKRKKQLAIKG